MINVTRSSMPSFQEYCVEIKEMWDSHWLTNMGKKHRELEERLKLYLDAPYITLYVNGHLALENAIAAMRLEPGSEVITTPFTFASTTHAIVRNGLKPVFADICYSDYTIDPEQVKKLVTDKTSAIVPVHVYGNICNVEKLKEIAEDHHLKLIYDAAHAFGIRVNGVSVASFGDATMFSFHATKVFNTIEGGAVTYNNKELQVILDDLKNFGIHGPEDVDYVGGNAKMNEFAAAMGICNLRHLDSEIEKRGRVVERYRANLANTPGIILISPQPGVKSNYGYFPVLFDGFRKTRDDVFDDLKKHDIIARKYFYPLTNSFACYRGLQGFDPDLTPVAKYIAERILTLPLYADLSLTDVDRICEIVTG